MDRYKRLTAPISAVVFVGLLAVTIVIGSTPDTNATAAKAVSFITHHQRALKGTSYMLIYGGLAALLFFCAVAGYLRRRGSDLLATTTIAGAAVFTAGLGLGAGLNFAAADQVKHVSPTVTQTLNVLQNDAFAFVMFGGLCAAMLSLGVASLRTKAFPTWLGVVMVVDGVAAATGFASWPAFLLLGPITLVVGWFMYSRSAAPEEIQLPEIPSARMSTEAGAQTKATATS